MSAAFDRSGRQISKNDAVAAQLAAQKRRRIWKIVIGANAAAIIAAIAGCLLMVKSQGVKADVEDMRNEVGEHLTMMTLGNASEAIAKHIPKLISTTTAWDRKFAAKREDFRGLDQMIDQVQAMH